MRPQDIRFIIASNRCRKHGDYLAAFEKEQRVIIKTVGGMIIQEGASVKKRAIGRGVQESVPRLGILFIVRQDFQIFFHRRYAQRPAINLTIMAF